MAGGGGRRRKGQAHYDENTDNCTNEGAITLKTDDHEHFHRPRILGAYVSAGESERVPWYAVLVFYARPVLASVCVHAWAYCS